MTYLKLGNPYTKTVWQTCLSYLNVQCCWRDYEATSSIFSVMQIITTHLQISSIKVTIIVKIHQISPFSPSKAMFFFSIWSVVCLKTRTRWFYGALKYVKNSINSYFLSAILIIMYHQIVEFYKNSETIKRNFGPVCPFLLNEKANEKLFPFSIVIRLIRLYANILIQQFIWLSFQ